MSEETSGCGAAASGNELWELLHIVLPRFLRITVKTPGKSLEEVIANFQQANENVPILQVPWLSNFVSVPGYVPISSLLLPEEEGVHVFPMDIASGVPAHILGSSCGPSAGGREKVLDLCCCPGGKFLMMSDYFGSDATLVGVDVSHARLFTTKSLVHKYVNAVYASQDCPSARMLLVCADGTTFCEEQRGQLVYDSRVGLQEISNGGYKRKRNKSTRGREQRGLKRVWEELAATPDGEKGICGSCFDAVLVDAQCTHDSSYRHMRYVGAGGSSTTASNNNVSGEASNDGDDSSGVAGLVKKCNSYKNIESVESDESVYELQRKLLAKGFASLAPGGELVYSTCSAEEQQNERVVEWLLEQERGKVELVPVDDWCAGTGSNHLVQVGDVEDSGQSCGSGPLDQLVHLLRQEPPRLHDLRLFLRLQQREQPAEGRTREGGGGLRALADDMCRYSAAFAAAPGRPGRLAGSVYFGMWAGTSGLFLCRLRRVDGKMEDEGLQLPSHSPCVASCDR